MPNPRINRHQVLVEMEPSKDFEDFLWLPYMCAKLTGMDPIGGRETLKFKIGCVVVVFGILNHFFIMTGEFIYLYRHHSEMTSLLEVTKIVAIIAYGTNTNAKFIAVFSDPTLVRNVLNTTEVLFPKSSQDKRAYRVNENFWPMSTYVLTGMYIVCGWTFYCMPGILAIYQCLQHGDELSYEPPFKVDHFFDYRTKLRYGLLYFSEFWAGHLCACSNLGTDLLLCCLVMQMCMHFKHIGREIEHFQPTGKPDDCEFLVGLIERHQLILKLCVDVNEIFGTSLVFNLFSSSGVICLAAFQVSSEGLGLEVLKFSLMLVSCMEQLFIVCHFGNELISCSLGIAESVGNHAWYDGDAAYKRMLVFFVLRCQKPVMLSAKQYLTVSLQTFKQVTSMSYRIFTLLNTFPNENL